MSRCQLPTPRPKVRAWSNCTLSAFVSQPTPTHVHRPHLLPDYSNPNDTDTGDDPFLHIASSFTLSNSEVAAPCLRASLPQGTVRAAEQSVSARQTQRIELLAASSSFS